MRKTFNFFFLFFFMLSSCSSSTEATATIGEKMIFIDPGHGGKDNGCVFENVYEDEINLKIATYLFEEVIQHHFMSYITRVDDYDLASLQAKNRKNEDLKKRAEAIEKSHCDLFISIHLNSYPSLHVHGPMVYYEKGNDSSKKIAEIFQTNLNQFTNQNKKIHTSDFYLFRNTSRPGILVECGFLSNPEDRKNLFKETYQKNIAHQLYISMEQYFMEI